jgi:hypothetical protein
VAAVMRRAHQGRGTRCAESSQRRACVGDWGESSGPGDHFTSGERVRGRTRFVPTDRATALSAQKKNLQKRRKPTPGLEPGTPSLRVKIQSGPESTGVLKSPMIEPRDVYSAGPRRT